VADGIVGSSVAWETDPVTITANQALNAVDDQGAVSGAGSEAEELLRDILAGGPVAMKDIQAEAREAGLSWATVRRAKDRLGVIAERDGFGSEGKWLWRLPDPPSTKGAHSLKGAQNMSTFGENEHLRVADPPKMLTSVKDAHPSKVSTLQKNEHLAAVNRARAPIESAPADDLDIPEFLRRTPETSTDRRPALSPVGDSLDDLEAL
jgi:hypothetical protein